jgi:CIC family chloride channel protein
MVGVITSEILRATAGDPEVSRVALADDMMGMPISIRDTDDLHNALELMIANAMRELLVVDEDGKVLGVVDQTEITIAYLAATARRG